MCVASQYFNVIISHNDLRVFQLIYLHILLVLINFLSWYLYKILNTKPIVIYTDTSKMNRYLPIPILELLTNLYELKQLFHRL